MQISVDDGLNWTNATNGNSITNLSESNSLVYRVIFDADGTKEFGISDLNISWKHADITNPIVTLVSPDNSSKLIGNGSVSFAFNVSDNDAYINCSFFLNSVLNKSWNCSTGVNLTVNLTLDRGFYYWEVLANDSANNTDISENRSLWIIDDYSARVEKKIISESSGMYTIKTVVKNLVDSAIRFSLYDFVDRTFNYGSFNVSQNITNSTTGPDYIGDVLGWFMDYSTNSSLERNYSIAGTNSNYTFSDNFVIGLD